METHRTEILGKLGIQSEDELARLGFDKFSKVQVIAVEMHTGSATTGSSVDGVGHISGGTYEWHLMKTVSGGVLYELSVHRPDPWLEMGTYLAMRTDKGFEALYHDKKGRLRHETLYIMGEEPYAQK